MSNQKEQPKQEPAAVTDTETTAVINLPATEPKPGGPLIVAVKLCLEMFLRSCLYGSVPRSYEGQIKEAISSLE